MRRQHSVGLLVGAGLALGILAGCGSSASTSSGSATASAAARTGGGRAIVADDKAYAHYLNPDPAATVAPLGKKAPTGKTMDIITCPVAICGIYTDGAQQAASALGWKTKVLVSQLTPTSYEATWNTVDQDKPNVVFVANVTPLSVVAKQVLAAKASGSVLVAYGVPQIAGTAGTTAAARAFSIDVNGVPAETLAGRVQALQAIHDSQGPPNVLILDDPSVGAVVAIQVASEERTLKAAGATVAVLDVSSADIGTTIPGTVVTYLQAHPDVKYITVPFDDYLSGIPEALGNAGLASKVKLIGTAADGTSQQEVAQGQIFASAATPTQANAWWMVDGAARALVGDPIPDQNPPGPLSILTKTTSPAIGSATTFPSSVYSKLRTAWGVN